MGWDRMEQDGMDGMGWMRWFGAGQDGWGEMGWMGPGWDGTGWVGWDGTGWNRTGWMRWDRLEKTGQDRTPPGDPRCQAAPRAGASWSCPCPVPG